VPAAVTGGGNGDRGRAATGRGIDPHSVGVGWSVEEPRAVPSSPIDQMRAHEPADQQAALAKGLGTVEKNVTEMKKAQ